MESALLDMKMRKGRREDVIRIMEIVHMVVPLMEASANYQWGSKNQDCSFYPDTQDFEADADAGTLWVIEGQLDGSADPCILAAAALTADQPEEYGTMGMDLTVPAVVPHRLAVHPMVHGRGLARKLFLKAEELARESGCDLVRVDTSTRNAAMNALIQSIGYERRGGDFSFPGKAEGMRFAAYEKRL